MTYIANFFINITQYSQLVKVIFIPASFGRKQRKQLSILRQAATSANLLNF